MRGGHPLPVLLLLLMYRPLAHKLSKCNTCGFCTNVSDCDQARRTSSPVFLVGERNNSNIKPQQRVISESRRSAMRSVTCKTKQHQQLVRHFANSMSSWRVEQHGSSRHLPSIWAALCSVCSSRTSRFKSSQAHRHVDETSQPCPAPTHACICCYVSKYLSSVVAVKTFKFWFLSSVTSQQNMHLVSRSHKCTQCFCKTSEKSKVCCSSSSPAFVARSYISLGRGLRILFHQTQLFITISLSPSLPLNTVSVLLN